MRNSGSRSREGSQPMPAFWLSPKRLPEGWVSSISAESGREPDGPGAWDSTLGKLGDSRTDASEIVSIAGLAFESSYSNPSIRARSEVRSEERRVGKEC